jgi:single-stranded-DNA-specific exonuclease
MKTIVQRSLPESTQRGLPQALHPVLRRVYSARNVTTGIELDNSLTRLYPPADLKGISTAVDLLSGALLRQEKILVVGKAYRRRWIC